MIVNCGGTISCQLNENKELSPRRGFLGGELARSREFKVRLFHVTECTCFQLGPCCAVLWIQSILEQVDYAELPFGFIDSSAAKPHDWANIATFVGM